MEFRYYDMAGNQIALEDLNKYNVMTPVMEHVLAKVLARVNGPQNGIKRAKKDVD